MEEPQVSRGTAHCEWILGGPYLQSVHHGTFGGMPFEGRGLCGCDNEKMQYSDLWIDNMSTGYIAFTGGLSADVKTFTETSTAFDLRMQRDTKYRTVTQIVDPNRLVYSMFQTGMDGSETRVMEMTYTR